MLRNLYIAMFFVLLFCSDSFASTQQGQAALRAGDYRAAVALLSPQAQAGDSDAQFGLCGMYFLGQGVPVNEVEAFQWCKLAADQGNVEAMFNTALFYQKGQGVSQDFPAAVAMYEKAADAGHKDAQFNLLQMYNANVLASQAGTAGGLDQGLLPPLGVPLDSAGNPVSFNPLKVPPEQRGQQLATAGVAATAGAAVAIPQAAGGQVPSSVLQQLSRRVENAAPAGQVATQAPSQIASRAIAQLPSASTQIPTAAPAAVSLPTQVAAPRSVIQLTPAEQERQRSESACLEAARQGILAENCGQQEAPIVDAQPQKIAAVQATKAVEKQVDVTKTIGWFEKQAELGDLAAQNNLGVIYRRGTGVPKNPEKALQLFEESAARGSVNGMLNLANMYKLGEGKEQNLELSYAWYSLASDRLQAGEGKRKALENIKEIASFMNNQEIGSALEYVTQLDSTIPMIDESQEQVGVQ